MKLNGIFGTGSGKTGNAVFATSAGKQIVRTYQPKVSNPNTPAQVAQRAKFKLLSQLAAAMAPVIVFKKDGLTSARNLFVKKNSDLANYAEDVASIVLTGIDLTGSKKAIPALVASMNSETGEIQVSLESPVNGIYEKVLYALFKKNDDNKLQLMAVKDVGINDTTEASAATTFTGQVGENFVIYAYGMNAISSAAKGFYSDYEAQAGGQDARLETALSVSASNYEFSMTVAEEIE